MERTFNPDAFIRRIGERLVDEFRDAKAGTTPSGVGSAAEQPVRNQLEQVLPRGMAVGEGFVIDSYGGTSRQQDVIVYERDICPVFSVNRTPQTTYYPCEGVIAVGEIKSWLDADSLRDAFHKVASVKALRRHAVADFMPNPTTGEPIPLKRDYLSTRGDSVVRLDDGPEQKERAQVFGFVLAGESRLSRETLVATFGTLSADIHQNHAPNLLLTLDGHIVNWGKIAKGERREVRQSADGTYGLTVHKDGPEGWHSAWSAGTATHVGGSERSETFRTLVRRIWQCAELGRTSHVRSFDRYFDEKAVAQSAPVVTIPKLPSRVDG